jgi:hypothetical protein
VTQTTFPIAAGAYTAHVRAPQELCPALAAVLCDLIIDHAPTGAEVASVEEDGVGRWRIVAGRRVYATRIATEDVPDEFVKMLLLATRDAEPDSLFLHAGLVSMGDREVVIAGPSGSGKTTLIAALVREGWRYLADEMVAVRVDGPHWTYRKPISLLPGAFLWFAEFDPAVTGHGHASASVWQIPGSAIERADARPTAPGSRNSRRDILWLDRRSTGQARLASMSAADMVVALLADSQAMYRPITQAHLAHAAAYCAPANGARLEYSDLPGALAAVERMAPTEPTGPAVAVSAIITPTTSVVTGGGPLTGDSHVGMSPGWAGIGIGDAAVVLHRPSGRLIQLDGTTFTWLQLFDGATSVSDLAAEIALANDLPADAVVQASQAFASELHRHGVVQW